jgi:hypothetical protein
MDNLNTTATITPPHGHAKREREGFKDALLVAFHRLGGIEYLVEFGRTHPAEFVRTCGRLIPLEVRGMPTTQVTILHALPPGELDRHPTPETIHDISMAIPHHEKTEGWLALSPDRNDADST